MRTLRRIAHSPAALPPGVRAWRGELLTTAVMLGSFAVYLTR
jgi:hypothetical protein